MSGRSAQSPLRLPRRDGARDVSGFVFDDAMQQIERALSGAVRQGTTPSLPGLILTAPDGSSWRLTVAADGTLQTAPVLR